MTKFGVQSCAKSSILRFLAGLQPVSHWRTSLLYQNYQRYKYDDFFEQQFRTAELIMNSEKLRTRGRTHKAFQHSQVFLNNALRLSTFDDTDLYEPIAQFTEQHKPRKLKATLKHILGQNDNMLTFRKLRDTLMTQCFTAGMHHPLLRLRGKLYTNYISWLVGTIASAEIPFEFRPLREIDSESDSSDSDDADKVTFTQPSDLCRACENAHETRLHLLTECPRTLPLRDNFENRLKDFPNKLSEYQSLPPQHRWLWILAGGTLPLPLRQPDHRTHPRTTVFLKGERINLPKDSSGETTVEDCLEPFSAYQELKQKVQRQCPHNCLNVYTDGSHEKNPRKSGAAAIVYQHGHRPVTLHTHTGTSTNNYAELHAVLLLLHWLRKKNIQNTSVNIFTDSTYVQDRLTDPMIPRQNFYLIQEIMHYATVLHSEAQLHFTVHKIPAHLDELSNRRYIIPENTAVDIAAKQARDTPHPFQTTNHQRQQMLHLCAELLMRISDLLTPSSGSSSVQTEGQHSSSATAKRTPRLLRPTFPFHLGGGGSVL